MARGSSADDGGNPMDQQRLDDGGGWRLWAAALGWVGLLVAVGGGLLAVDRALPARFFAGVTGGLILVAVVVGWSIRRTGGRSITLATVVTLVRGASLAAFSGVLAIGVPFDPLPWLPAGLFALAAGLDPVDGAIARRTDAVSDLGGRLDTEMDGLTVLLGTVGVVAGGLVPAVFLLVGLARYAFVVGIWLRRRRGRPVGELPPSRLRRVLGGLAMATIWLALLPVVDPTVSRPVALAVFVPFLLNFGRDWLSVSGRR